MASNGTIRAIDADGHFLERKEDVAAYLEEPWLGRTEVWPGDQPWAAELEIGGPPPYDYVGWPQSTRAKGNLESSAR